MKLRWKIAKRSRTETVLINTSPPTLQHLRAELESQLQEKHGIIGELFKLSLNGHTSLEEDDGTLLTDLGIVQGDVIYILGISEHFPQEHKIGQVSKDSLQQAQELGEVSQETKKNHGSEESIQREDKAATSGLGAGSVSVMPQAVTDHDDQIPVEMEGLLQEEMVEVNRYLKEPLLIYESTSESVPVSVPVLLEAMGKSVTTVTDIFVCLLHILMLETGFLPFHDQSNDSESCKQIKSKDKPCVSSDSHSGFKRKTKFTEVPSGWHHPGGYRLRYTAPYSEGFGPCDLVIAPLGSIVNIGTIPSVTMQLFKPEDYVSKATPLSGLPTFYNLTKLSQKFKNLISYSLASMIQQQCGTVVQFGLMALPLEVRLKLFSFLDCATLLTVSETSKDMYQTANEACLWKKLLFRDYPSKALSLCNRDTTVDWKEEYKNKYILQRVFLKRRRDWAFISPESCFPQFGVLDRRFVPIPVPGVIGGEFDRIPNFESQLRGSPRHGSDMLCPTLSPHQYLPRNPLFRW